jgi:hypothetical protein
MQEWECNEHDVQLIKEFGLKAYRNSVHHTYKHEHHIYLHDIKNINEGIAHETRSSQSVIRGHTSPAATMENAYMISTQVWEYM